jgi:hypothetical protein
MEIVLYLTGWVAWFGSFALVMMIDRKFRRERAAASGEVDFSDDRIVQYLLLGLICGALVLPIYFYATRRSIGWALIGLALTVPCLIAVVIVQLIVSVVLGSIG